MDLLKLVNPRFYQRLTLLSVSTMLCGCLGGSIGQQVMQSILLKGADKAAEAAIESHERKTALEAQKNTEIDPYTLAFANAGFQPVTPQVEPLPETVAEVETPLPLIQETKLVEVEIWNLLAGVEKEKRLEKARLQGSLQLPPKAEWIKWQIAIGATRQLQTEIIFLIPPEMGKMRSGQKAMVEVLPTGELSMARYSLN